MPRDLRARGHRPQLLERELGRRFDEAADLQLVVDEAGRLQGHVIGIGGVEGAVAAKTRCHVGRRELLRHGRLRRHDAAGGVAQVLCALQHIDEGLVVREPVAAGEHRRASGRDRAAKEMAAIALLGAHQRVDPAHGNTLVFSAA